MATPEERVLKRQRERRRQQNADLPDIPSPNDEDINTFSSGGLRDLLPREGAGATIGNSLLALPGVRTAATGARTAGRFASQLANATRGNTRLPAGAAGRFRDRFGRVQSSRAGKAGNEVLRRSAQQARGGAAGAVAGGTAVRGAAMGGEEDETQNGLRNLQQKDSTPSALRGDFLAGAREADARREARQQEINNAMDEAGQQASTRNVRPEDIPGVGEATENIDAALDGQSALRQLQQRPGFRFASAVGEFGEPVFDNSSIDRLNAADPESLRGGLSVVPAPEQDLTAAGLARDLQAGLRTEEEVAQILDSQDISNRARVGDDANRIAAFRAGTERAGLRDASREIFTPRFDNEGNFVESVLSKDVSAKQAESFTNTMSRPLATIAPDLGFESTEAAQGAFQTYLMNSSNQRGEGDDAIPANPAILFSAFALNRALSDEAGVSTPNTFQAGIDVLGEYVATEAPTLFGFGSAAGNVAGGSAKFDNLPAEVKRELNANRQAVKDSLLGQLENPIGRKFNASYATGVAEQLKGVEDQLKSASRVRSSEQVNRVNPLGGPQRNREAQGVQQALEQTGTLDRIKTLRERARELSQGIISGEITDPTAVQALDAQMAEIGKQIQGSAALRQAAGIELDSLRTR